MNNPAYQAEAAHTVEKATKLLNAAIKVAEKQGVEVGVSLVNGEIQQVKTKISIPAEEEDEDDILL